MYEQLIVSDPNVMMGKPVIAGTRITVELVLEKLAAGESIEQTVHREILEEVGLRVGSLKYFGSQSWPFPNSLMLGFHAEYESGEISCQDDEIAEARWFDVDDLPNIPPRSAISRWLIDEFIDEVKATA